MRFHRRCGDRVTLLNDDLTAVRNFVEFNHGLVLSSEPLEDDVMFEVCIDRKVNVWNGSLEIGVTTLDPEYMELPATATKLRDQAWIMSGSSIVMDGVTLINSYGPELDTLREGDCVGVMRTSKAELLFYVNSRCLGVAATDVPPNMFAVIDLYGQCVQVTKTRTTETSIMRPVSETTMDQIAESPIDDTLTSTGMDVAGLPPEPTPRRDPQEIRNIDEDPNNDDTITSTGMDVAGLPPEPTPRRDPMEIRNIEEDSNKAVTLTSTEMEVPGLPSEPTPHRDPQEIRNIAEYRNTDDILTFTRMDVAGLPPEPTPQRDPQEVRNVVEVPINDDIVTSIEMEGAGLPPESAPSSDPKEIPNIAEDPINDDIVTSIEMEGAGLPSEPGPSSDPQEIYNIEGDINNEDTLQSTEAFMEVAGLPPEPGTSSGPKEPRNVYIPMTSEGACALVVLERLRFHPRCGILVKLSCNNKCAERARPLDDYNNGVVMTHRPLYDDEMFEIRIDRLVDKWSGSIEVGVTNHNPATMRFPSTMTNMDTGTIMMSGCKVLINGHGTCMEYGNFNLDELREGDTVGMMRKSNGKLHYYINGLDQGVATDKVDPQVWGVVDLYGMTVKVSIVDPYEDIDSNINQPIFVSPSPEFPTTSRFRPNIDEDSLLFHTLRDSNVIIINDGKTAHRPNAFKYFNNGIVMTNRTLKPNELFQVRLDLVIPKWAGSIEIGVTQHSSNDIQNPFRMSNAKSGTWAITGEDVIRDGTIVIPQYVRNLNKLVEGDTVGVMRNDLSILHFFVNGMDEGPAAFNVPENVYGIIDLYGRAAQATIVDTYCPPPMYSPESPFSTESNATIFPEMCFHRVHGRNARLSRNNRLTAWRATVYSEFNDAVLFSSRPLRECDMFEVRIDKMVDCWIGSLEIGVTAIRPEDLEASGGVGAVAGTATDLNWDTYILSGAAMMKDGECVRSGYPLDLDALTVGSRVGMMWHADRSLHYYLDGMDMGRAWYVPHLNIYAVIDLYGQCTQVTILQNEERAFNACSNSDNSMLSNSRALSSPPPPYWSFSEYCGDNICLMHGYSVARRLTADPRAALVFSSAHLAVNEMFEIKVAECKFGYAGSFRMGVTDINILNAHVNRSLPPSITGLPHYTAYIDGRYMKYSLPGVKEQEVRSFVPSLEWLRPGDRLGLKKTSDARVQVYYNSELLDTAFQKVPDKVYVVMEIFGSVNKIQAVAQGNAIVGINQPSNVYSLPQNDDFPTLFTTLIPPHFFQLENNDDVFEPNAPVIEEVPVDEPVDGAIDEPVDRPIDIPVDEPVIQPVNQLIGEPFDELVDGPVDQIIDEPFDDLFDEPVNGLVNGLANGPVDEPFDDSEDDESADDPVDELDDEPDDDEPDDEQAEEPVDGPVNGPDDGPVMEPVVGAVVGPVVGPVDEPVGEPVDEPVDEPVEEPVDTQPEEDTVGELCAGPSGLQPAVETKLQCTEGTEVSENLPAEVPSSEVPVAAQNSTEEQTQQPRRRNLPYTFHYLHGLNIKLCSSDTVAMRTTGYNEAVAIVSQPLRRGHNFRFRVDKVSSEWWGTVTIGAVGSLPTEGDLPTCAVHMRGPVWLLSSDILYDSGNFSTSHLGMALDDLGEQSVLTIHFRFNSELVLEIDGKVIGPIATINRRHSHVFPTIDLYGRITQVSVLLHPYVVVGGASLDLPVITENQREESLAEQELQEGDEIRDEAPLTELRPKRKFKAHSQDNLLEYDAMIQEAIIMEEPSAAPKPSTSTAPEPSTSTAPEPMPSTSTAVDIEPPKAIKPKEIQGRKALPIRASLHHSLILSENVPFTDNNEMVNRCIQKSHSTHSFCQTEENENRSALQQTFSVGSRVGDSHDIHQQFCDTNIQHNDRYPEASDVDNLDNEIMDALTLEMGNLPDLSEEQSLSLDDSTRRDDIWSDSLSSENLQYLNRILCLDQEGAEGHSLESEWEASGEGCEHLHHVLKYWNYLVLPYPELRAAVSWGQVRCYCPNCQPDAQPPLAGWVRIERIDGVGAAQRGFWHVARSTLGAAQSTSESGNVRRPRSLTPAPSTAPPLADIWFDEEGKPHHTVLAIEIDIEGSEPENDRLLAFLIYLKPHALFAEDNSPSFNDMNDE